MLNRLPRHMPPFEAMLADIGNPETAAIAKALGVSARTVRRWLQTGTAPRAAALAIFWATRWGMSKADSEAHNAATMHAGMAALARLQLEEAKAAHAAEVAKLEARIEMLSRVGDFGAANDPAPLAQRAVPELPVIAVPGEAPPPHGATGPTGQDQRETARMHRVG